jgi:hypothetical protein
VGVLRRGGRTRGPGGKIGLPGGGGTREVIEYFYRPYIGFLGRKTSMIELNERTKKILLFNNVTRSMSTLQRIIIIIIIYYCMCTGRG